MIHGKKLQTPPFEHLKDCFLAGGAILSNVIGVEINDYDIYPKDQSKIFDLIYYFMAEEGMELVSETDRSISFKSNHLIGSDGRRKIVQIIKIKDFTNVEDIFNSFDFTVCMAAYDYDTKKYHFHDSFYPDVAARRININVDTKYPYASLVRIKKYSEKGFKLSKSESIKLGMSIARVGLPNSWAELSDAIGGIYGKSIEIGDNKEYNFDNAIEELSNLVITEPVENTDLHKAMEKIVKSKAPDLAYKLYLNDKAEIETNYIDFCNVHYYVENDVITDTYLKTVSSPYSSTYSFNTLIPQEEIKNNISLVDVVKFNHLKEFEKKLEVYVLAIENEAITIDKNDANSNYGAKVFKKVEFEYGVPTSQTILVFGNIASAMTMRDKYISSNTEESKTINFYKATVPSKNVRHSYTKDMLMAVGVNIEGL